MLRLLSLVLVWNCEFSRVNSCEIFTYVIEIVQTIGLLCIISAYKSVKNYVSRIVWTISITAVKISHEFTRENSQFHPNLHVRLHNFTPKKYLCHSCWSIRERKIRVRWILYGWKFSHTVQTIRLIWNKIHFNCFLIIWFIGQVLLLSIMIRHCWSCCIFFEEYM